MKTQRQSSFYQTKSQFWRTVKKLFRAIDFNDFPKKNYIFQLFKTARNWPRRAGFFPTKSTTISPYDLPGHKDAQRYIAWTTVSEFSNPKSFNPLQANTEVVIEHLPAKEALGQEN